VIHPGYRETPLMASANPVFVQAHLAMTPQSRAGTVDEAVPLVVYLLAITNAPEASRGARQRLLGPDDLGVGGVAGPPAFGELGDQEEAAAALVLGAGAAQPG
jgi:NAD(P)-dependent dehydrogenase (short-subunit alcohol dehydrogenase family)